MTEEIKTSPDIVPDSNTAEPFAPETLAGESAPAETPVPAVRKNDPWKTAFIVLLAIAVISGIVFYTGYARKTDLPTAPVATADANAQPVQMAYPPTGASETAALAVPVMQGAANASDLMAIPGSGGYDPWANPGRFQQQQSNSSVVGALPAYPAGPAGQQLYMQTNPNSPFMSDGNTYVMMPANANTAVNANRPASNSNTRLKPTALPTPATTTLPAANTAVPIAPVKNSNAPADKPAGKPTPKKPPAKQNGEEEK